MSRDVQETQGDADVAKVAVVFAETPAGSRSTPQGAPENGWALSSSPSRYRDPVPAVVVFKCEICGKAPDPETQHALERQLLDLRHGEYVDAGPARWLTWHGRGIYGPNRYACGEHRGELKAHLREHYGTLGWHPWAMGPHPWAGRRGTDRARQLARSLGSTFGAPGS